MYSLICKTCKATAPYCATTEEELENPFSYSTCECCGQELHDGQGRAVEAIERFREQHEDCELEIREL